jgi:hypothetical protein
MNAMKGQFSMGALKPPCHKKPVGQKVTGEGKLPAVAGEKGYVKLMLLTWT